MRTARKLRTGQFRLAIQIFAKGGLSGLNCRMGWDLIPPPYGVRRSLLDLRLSIVMARFQAEEAID